MTLQHQGRCRYQPGRHVRALDGVRGLAILLVMIFHFTHYGGMEPTVAIDSAYAMLASATWCGVDLFFVLSGFLITGILYDAKGSDGYFRIFYIRRSLRIFPLYYGALVLFLFIIPPLPRLEHHVPALLDDQVWFWSYLANGQFAFEQWPAYSLLGHFWSLAVEEQFYLIWPFVVFMLSRRSLMTATVVCIASALVLRCYFAYVGNWTAAFVLMPARIDALATGAFVALAIRDPDSFARMQRCVRPVLWWSGLAILGLLVEHEGLRVQHVAVHTIGFTLLAVFFGAAIVATVEASSTSRTHRLFISDPMTQLGRYSYALYVFHQPVIYYVTDHIVAVPDIPAVLGSQLLGQLVVFMVAGAISLACALVSWHLYEKHFIKLKKYFVPSRKPTRR